MIAEPPSPHRLDRLFSYLKADPGNATLIREIAEASLAARRFDITETMIDRLVTSGDDASARNLAGLLAMHRRDFAAAAEAFAGLESNAAPVRFNLAWSLAMLGRHREALDQLVDASETLPAAAMLEVQLRHQLGDFDGAAERAQFLIALHPDDPGLNAAASVLALDIDDVELARVTASRAPDHPDALATLGTLALADDDGSGAAALFERSLAINAHNARAWVGAGLACLTRGDATGAARSIDRGAEIFGSHLGSWIAAGWAHQLAGDPAAARARFERALSIDASFAESHGSLAVLDILAGDVESGRQRAEVATRLDRGGFAGALAQTLLASSAGDAESARRFFERAINQPLDIGNRTLAQALAKAAL